VAGRVSLAGFLVTWLCNVTAAAVVYSLARKHGQRFFKTKAGHWLLHPRQLEQIGKFYHKWGTPAILLSRFLPAFRAAVPVFAGVSHLPFLRMIVPLAVASGVWYGILVYIGAFAGDNWEEITEFFSRFSTILLAIAGVLVAAFWSGGGARAATTRDVFHLEAFRDYLAFERGLSVRTSKRTRATWQSWLSI
jgi:membrane protein DedA with SNARE-associated domain